MVEELEKRTKSLELAVLYNTNGHPFPKIDILDLAHLFLIYMENGDFLQKSIDIKEDLKKRYKERHDTRNCFQGGAPLSIFDEEIKI